MGIKLGAVVVTTMMMMMMMIWKKRARRDNNGGSQSQDPCFIFSSSISVSQVGRPLADSMLWLGGASNVLSQQPKVKKMIRPRTESLVVEGCDDGGSGVLCLSDYNTSRRTIAVYLWNPARKQIKRLRLPPTSISMKIHPGFRLGLGRDPVSGDLKVVMLSRTPIVVDSRLPSPLQNLFTRGTTRVSVYNSGTRSWREASSLTLPADEPSIGNYECSVTAGGCVHWRVTMAGERLGIVAFDLTMEAFRAVNLPPELDSRANHTRIGKLLDSLSVVAHTPEQSSINVWVMEQKSCAWTKHATLRTPGWMRPISTKIGLANTGHLIYASRLGMIWYNLHTRTVKHYYPYSGPATTFITQYIATSSTTNLNGLL